MQVTAWQTAFLSGWPKTFFKVAHKTLQENSNKVFKVNPIQKATSRVSVHVNKEQSKRKKMSGTAWKICSVIFCVKKKKTETTERTNCLTGMMETLGDSETYSFVCAYLSFSTHTQFFLSFEKECQTSSGRHNF